MEKSNSSDFSLSDLPQPVLHLIYSFLPLSTNNAIYLASSYTKNTVVQHYKNCFYAHGWHELFFEHPVSEYLLKQQNDLPEIEHNYAITFQTISTRLAASIDASIRFDPHRPEGLKHALAQTIPSLRNIPIHSLDSGGRFSGMLTFEGHLYLTKNNDAATGLVEAFKEGARMPQKVKHFACGGHDVSYLTDEGEVYCLLENAAMPF